MAIYHFNAKILGRSQGRSAIGAAAYRSATRIEDARTGLVFDYTRKRGVDGAEILTPDGSTPDRAALWGKIELREGRSDAQLAREVEVALPRELEPEQMRTLVRAFVREQFVTIGMIADIAFHHLTGSNPHAHILLTMREQQGDGFGLKRREWNDRALCELWRKRWSDHANDALARAGHLARIDHRTLIEQAGTALAEERHSDAIELDRLPTIHERGSPMAAAHNASVRRDNSEHRAQWEAIEPNARAAGRLVSPACDAPPSSMADRLAAEDLAFIAAMRERRDTTARGWRRYDERAQALADWLRTKAGGDARRLAARDRAAMDLQAARSRRDLWLEDHPRPLWFWRLPEWQRQLAAAQGPVDKAKRRAAHGEECASPQAITAWRRTYADHQAAHAAALAARRVLAPTPSEQATEARQRIAERTALAQTRRRSQSLIPVSSVSEDQGHGRTPAKPGRRPH